MNVYSKPIEALGLPDAIRECAIGKLPIPLVAAQAPAAWYGFPPALIPIWSEGSRPTYMAYWKHWFSERDPSFVKMYVASNRMVIEVARTAEQFFLGVVISSIVETDGIEQATRDFANYVGISDVEIERLDELSLQTGDDPAGFFALTEFQRATPREVIQEFGDYSGAFPVPAFVESNPWWNHVCSFELQQDTLSAWPKGLAIPNWLIHEENLEVKPKLFQQYFDDKDYEKAWLSLNSSGWRIKDARVALGALASVSNDPTFHALVDAWLATANESSESY